MSPAEPVVDNVGRHFIASSPIMSTPHVTAQWEGDVMTSVSIDRLDGRSLTSADVMSAFVTARKLKAGREPC